MSDVKVCKRCQIEKLVSEFYLSKGRPNAWCKKCQKIYAKERIQANPAKHREYTKTSYSNNEDKRKQYTKEYDTNNRHKIAAHTTIRRALNNGAPPPSRFNCAVCNKQAEIFHHWSYNPEHRRSVVPMCETCHNQYHFSNGASVGQQHAIELKVL